MKSRHILASAIFLALFLRPPGVSAQSPRFEAAPCPPEIATQGSVDCGRLVVPEDYSRPEGYTIELPVVIVRSQAEDPAADPLLILTGLPGANLTAIVDDVAGSRLTAERDVILMEQRGAGAAVPSLACEVALLRDNALPCLESLRAQQLSLEAFQIEAMADDVETLRQALGYERWNLLGQSYSTRIVNRIMELHPEGIRSAVLDSYYPPDTNLFESAAANFDRALGAFFAECAGDPACQAAYPDLPARFADLVERLNARPVLLDVFDPDSGGTSTATINGDWLVFQTFDALYGRSSLDQPLGYWPLLISRVEQGQTELLAPWVSQPVVAWEDVLTFGLYYATVCQADFARADPRVLAQQAQEYPHLAVWAESALGRSVCEAWDLPLSAPAVGGAVDTDIPLLILGGEHAPLTPPDWGQEAAGSLNAPFYTIAAAGQGVSLADPCAQDMVNTFLLDPASLPGAACQNKANFALPDEVLNEPSIYRYLTEIKSANADPRPKIALWVSLILFAVEILYLVAALARWLLRRRAAGKRAPRLAVLAHLLAGAVAVLGLAFAFALSQRVDEILAGAPLVLRFGLPAADRPLLLIPLVTDFLTAAMLVIAFLAWIVGAWSRTERLFYSLITVAALIFSSLMAGWGLVLL